MGTIISASLFFLVETGSYDASIGAYVIHGEVTQVQSIPDAFYWVSGRGAYCAVCVS